MIVAVVCEYLITILTKGAIQRNLGPRYVGMLLKYSVLYYIPRQLNSPPQSVGLIL